MSVIILEWRIFIFNTACLLSCSMNMNENMEPFSLTEFDHFCHFAQCKSALCSEMQQVKIPLFHVTVICFACFVL